MNYTVKTTTQFKKDYKTSVKRGLNPQKLEEVISLLKEGKVIPEKYRDHQLQPNRYTKTVVNYTSNQIGCLFISIQMLS